MVYQKLFHFSFLRHMASNRHSEQKAKREPDNWRCLTQKLSKGVEDPRFVGRRATNVYLLNLRGTPFSWFSRFPLGSPAPRVSRRKILFRASFGRYSNGVGVDGVGVIFPFFYAFFPFFGAFFPFFYAFFPFFR